MEIKKDKSYDKAEELFLKIDKLTSFFIHGLPDDVRIDVILIDVAINYLLKVLQVSLDCSIKPEMRIEAIECFKKSINQKLDEIKEKR